jgi:[NiFe] hydrogenase assembly HybE family chaperone
MSATEGLRPGAGFEGGWLADGLSDDAILECGICWRVYNPAIGEPVHAIDAHTPFMALPEGYHCPECGAPKEKFLIVEAGSGPKRGPHVLDMQARLDALICAYRDADLAMAGLPVYNSRLSISALGFRAHDTGYIGALVTPWFLNLVLLPQNKSDETRPPGASRHVAFPSGNYVFSAVKLERVGAFEFCSLFSPMLEFESQEAAQIAADAALQALFEPAAAPEPRDATPEAQMDASRRTLLFGRRRAANAPASA